VNLTGWLWGIQWFGFILVKYDGEVFLAELSYVLVLIKRWWRNFSWKAKFLPYVAINVP